MKSMGVFLLEKRKENKDKMESRLKDKYIGNMGEIFAYNYLKKLFERNGINYKFIPPKTSNEDYDLEFSINGRNYKFEVKFSTAKNHPVFHEIHFNNDFDYLLLIWHPSNDKIYFAVLSKEEAKDVATPENTNREDDDNWQIGTTEIFDEEFLKKLAMLLELNEELEDLEDYEKLDLLEDAEEEIMQNPDAVKMDFSGEIYQELIYDYLSNFIEGVELMPRGYKYDINYKGKGVEIKYSALNKNGEFSFKAIKPNNFDFILFVGFDNEENKFYFEIESKDEYVKNKRERTESDDIASRNGNGIDVGRSFFRFKNDFTFEDFDNYIETH